MGGSSGPNLPIPFQLFRDHTFGVLSWNARALLHGDVANRNKKLAFLKRHAVSKQIVCVQEVHGYEEQVRAALATLLPNFPLGLRA